MKYTVTLTDAVEFSPQTETEEILQNVRTLLKTRLGTVPLDRDMGLSWEHIDKPYPIAKAMLGAEVIDVIETYEPRARVDSVDFEETAESVMEGILTPRVIVSIGDDEEEEA